MLVSHYPNIFYLCGFTGSSGLLLVEHRRATLFTDWRYTIQGREEVSAARVLVTSKPLFEAAGEEILRRDLSFVGFSGSQLSVKQKRMLTRAVGPKTRWLDYDLVVESLRAVKDASEISRIRAAARLACAVLEDVLSFIKPGVKELEIAAELDYRMRKFGASGPSFETIVASGRRSTLPHARPTSKSIRKNELVVLDLGAILFNYCSDVTRTVYLGKAPARVRRWYQAVAEAQEAARQAIRPGVSAQAVDEAARSVLRQFKLDQFFTHSTGHGLGIEVHETPRLGRNDSSVLREGNVLTIEPGVYVEGVGGIRIEDDVVVTSRGAERITTTTREFLEL